MKYIESQKKGMFNLLKLDKLLEHLTGFINAKIELAKLEVKEELAIILAKTIILGALSFLALLATLFLSITLGYFLSDLLDNTVYGFLCVAGLYLLLFLTLLMTRNRLGLEEYFTKLLRKSLKIDK